MLNRLPFVSQHQQKTSLRSRWHLKSRVSRAGLVVAVVLGSLALFSFRGYDAHQRLSVRVPDGLAGFRSFSEARNLWNTGRYTPTSGVTPDTFSSYNWYQTQRPAYSKAYGVAKTSSSFLPPVTRADSSCGTGTVEDFVVEKRISTGDCNGGRLCRARVIVSKEGNQVTIKSGYYIFRNKGVTPLNPYTRRNVKKVTRREATIWAQNLLSKIQSDLDKVQCPVTADMIADGIMNTKDDAASCPRTDHPLCSRLFLLKTCTIAEPSGETEQEKKCVEFLESSSPVATFEELSRTSPCEDVSFLYNRIGMKAPFCTTTCPSCPNQERTVFINFVVQGANANGAALNATEVSDSLTSLYKAAYNISVASTLPACDNVPYNRSGTSSNGELLTVANYYEEARPPELETDRFFVVYTYYLSPGPVDDAINSTCSN